MKKILLVLFILLLTTINAQLSIDMNIKDNFEYGEVVTFDYSIYSDNDVSIEYSISVVCEDNPIPLGQIEEQNITRNQPFIGSYTYAKISDDYSSADCVAAVYIISPIKQSKSQNFSITSKNEFTLTPKACNKDSCKVVYLKGDLIELDYNSDVNGLEIKAKLTYPDNRIEDIVLPKEIKLSGIGSYSLDITASKEGYKTVNKKINFGVILKDAVIKNKFEKEDTLVNKNYNFTYYISIVILLFIIIILFKNKKENKIKDE